MKRIDILLCLELFNIRKCKVYPKQVIKDCYGVVRGLCSHKSFSTASFFSVPPINDFKTFKEEFRKYYLERSRLEYRYCQEFLDYLESFNSFIVDSF